MSLRLEPIMPGFGAYASGLDLSRSLSEDVLNEVVNALDEYAVVIFRDQSLTSEQHIAFMRQLGPLDTLNQKALATIQTRLPHEEVSDISNVAVDGSVAPKGHPQTMMNIGNRIWHSDSSFMHFPWRYSALYAVTVTDSGGETQWADMRSAYDALSDEDKALAESMIVEHFAGHSRASLGPMDLSQTRPASEAPNAISFAPTRWPLVRTHAGSGRKLLFVTSAIREVIGMSLPEGRALIAEFLEHTTQREFVITHKWRPGDIAIWDNRSVLHRGKRFDLSKRREMRRVATIDDVGSLPIAEADRTRIYGQPLI